MNYRKVRFGNFLNWCTRYASDGTMGYIENDENFSIVRPCFHDTYPSCKRNVKMKITIGIYKGTYDIMQWSRNHFCPFDFKTVKKHIEYLKNLFPFEYTVENWYGMYRINVKYSGKGIYFRILVSWIRYLYEFPANIILKEVYKIKDMPEFKDINLFSLHAFVCDSLLQGLYFDDHINSSAYRVSKLCTIDEIKQNIQRLIDRKGVTFRTMDIIPNNGSNTWESSAFLHNLNNILKPYLENRFGRERVNNYTTFKSIIRNYCEWFKEEYFNKRLELYRENLKVLKNGR